MRSAQRDVVQNDARIDAGGSDAGEFSLVGAGEGEPLCEDGEGEVPSAVVASAPAVEACQFPRLNFDGTAPQRAELSEDSAERDKAAPARQEISNDCIVADKMHGNKHPHHYKVIIVGESGLGKTTARDCFLHGLRIDSPIPGAELGVEPADGMAPKTATITTSEPIKLRTDNDREEIWLRIVDTPGYGDNLDATDDFRKIKDFIQRQYEALYDAQSSTPRCHDSLVTCCLYFIAPHRIKENDIRFMQEVSKMVPVVPVIAKADTMTRDETRRFRKVVSEELTKACLNLYDWRLPSGEPDRQVTDRTHGDELPTFTVIADKSMTEREYAWGTCNLLDRQHSDFPLLKDLVMKQHLELMHQRSFEIYEKLYRVPRHQREVGNGWTPPALRRLLIRSSDNVKAKLNSVSLAQVLGLCSFLLALMCVAVLAGAHLRDSRITGELAQARGLAAQLKQDLQKAEKALRTDVSVCLKERDATVTQISASKDEELKHKDVALATAKSRLEVCEQQVEERDATVTQISASKDEELKHKDVALTTAKSRLDVCQQQVEERDATVTQISASKDEELKHKDVALAAAKSRLDVCQQQVEERDATVTQISASKDEKLKHKDVALATAKSRLKVCENQVAQLQSGGGWWWQ